LKDDLKLLIRSSKNAFLAELLPQPVESTAKKATVGGFFKVQLTQLMDILNSTNPHWIRCIKPHPAKKPLHWDGVSVMNQLASSGVLGTVKIRKAGYPVRMKVADFSAKYNILGKTVEAIFKKGGVNKGMGQKGTVRVFLKTESFQELERQKKTALLEYARTAQAFARALREFQTIAVKQREANKDLYESLREKAVMLLELMDEETRVRAAIQSKLIRMKEDLKLNYDAKKVELEKEWRKVQVQRLREQYERKKREEAERAEEARLEKLRKDALERREREKKNREKELRDLERNAIEARMKRDAEELQMALAAKRALEHALEQQASKVFQEREKRRIEDKQKRDAAALRRAKLSEEQSDKLKTIVQITEEQQKRGEVMKLKINFEEKQARERQRIKMEGRRREVAARLREEEEAKQRMLEMQVSIANAKSTFQQAQRSQIEKDNCARRHLQVVERFELDREVQLREELRVQREDRARKADVGDVEKRKFEELLRGLEHRNTIQRREGDALVAPVYEYKSSAKTHEKITKISRSLQESGERVAAQAVVSSSPPHSHLV
jgi:myosin heavy subunit